MNVNTAGQKLQVFAFDHTTGAPVTGDAANITAYRSIDGGTVTVLTDTSATELSATNAPGWYQFDLSQAETNGQSILYTAKSITADVTVLGGIYAPLPAGFSTFVTPTGAAVGTVGAVISVGTVTGNVEGNVEGNLLGNVAGSVASVVAATDVSKIAGVTVTGSGTVADPWVGS